MNSAEGGIEAGTVLVDKYRIESVLGRGGMGIIYRAHHLALDEPVAIKVLRRDVSFDADTVERFVREGRAATRLKSQHVARIRDVGTFDDGLPYMVMEFLEGADLGQLVDANGAMNVPVAVDLVLQACDAISEAHSLGIVHRDIKPTNLFVSFRPDQTAIVKVLDFGISKSASGSDLSLTQTSSMLGTPAYMSPEQMRSARSVDARTDVWSIGTVLYELVEARRPFNAESFSEMCVMVAMDPPTPMVLAPELEPIIQRCLAKHPDQRYANVPELMRDLAVFAGNSEAARHFVTRAHRVLGLPVPTTLDSQPAIPRIVTYTTPVPSLPLSALIPTAPPDLTMTAAVPHDTQIVTSVRPSRAALVVAILAVVLGAGGAIVYVQVTSGTQSSARALRPGDQDAITTGNASAGTSAPVEGSRAGSTSTTANVDGSNGALAANGSGTATGSDGSNGSVGSSDSAGSFGSVNGSRGSTRSGAANGAVGTNGSGASSQRTGTVAGLRRLGSGRGGPASLTVGRPGGKPSGRTGGTLTGHGSAAEPAQGTAIVKPLPAGCDPYNSPRGCPK